VMMFNITEVFLSSNWQFTGRIFLFHEEKNRSLLNEKKRQVCFFLDNGPNIKRRLRG